VRRAGYGFRLFLPTPGGGWVGEAADGGGLGLPIDSDGAELAWLCYAWPITPGSSGKRTFLITQEGVVYGSPTALDGADAERGPYAGEAGFVVRDRETVTAEVTRDLRGVEWHRVQ
jgi:hypothetical protein